MSAVFQPPPPGTVVAPPLGGIVGKPPRGFVYPYWLPQIPGTVIPLPKVEVPAHECPTAVLERTCFSKYYGSVHDESISSTHIVEMTLRDCAITNCTLEDCTLVDCLVVSCGVSKCKLNDVELRGSKCFESTIHDVKATSDCRFGKCVISEADATDCRFFMCDVKSSEIKGSRAWDSKFNDATVTKILAFGDCTFTDCGGDVPKMSVANNITAAAPAPAAPYVGARPTSPDCPKEKIPCPSGLSTYYGKGTDDSISLKILVNKTLSDCEIKGCWIDDSTLTDCLLIDCFVNGGKLKDVELRSSLAFKADVDDVKGIGMCKFGQCTVHEGDLQNCHLDQCTVTSSEVTNGFAWDTKFRDVTLNKVETIGKCKFALCGGDVPKKADSDDDLEDNDKGNMPAPYNPNGTGGQLGGGGVNASNSRAASGGLDNGINQTSGPIGTATAEGYTYQFSPLSSSSQPQPSQYQYGGMASQSYHTVTTGTAPTSPLPPSAPTNTNNGYRMPSYGGGTVPQGLVPDASL